MKTHLSRLLLASISAITAFVSITLLLVLLNSIQLPANFQAFAPKSDIAEAMIRREISPDLQAELPLLFNNRIVLTKGWIECDTGESLTIKVSVKQSSTGASASGITHDFCKGELQNFDAITADQKPDAFEPGEAWACAEASTRYRNTTTDTYTWCKSVTLVNP